MRDTRLYVLLGVVLLGGILSTPVIEWYSSRAAQRGNQERIERYLVVKHTLREALSSLLSSSDLHISDSALSSYLGCGYTSQLEATIDGPREYSHYEVTPDDAENLFYCPKDTLALLNKYEDVYFTPDYYWIQLAKSEEHTQIATVGAYPFYHRPKQDLQTYFSTFSNLRIASDSASLSGSMFHADLVLGDRTVRFDFSFDAAEKNLQSIRYSYTDTVGFVTRGEMIFTTPQAPVVVPRFVSTGRMIHSPYASFSDRANSYSVYSGDFAFEKAVSLQQYTISEYTGDLSSLSCPFSDGACHSYADYVVAQISPLLQTIESDRDRMEPVACRDYETGLRPGVAVKDVYAGKLFIQVTRADGAVVSVFVILRDGMYIINDEGLCFSGTLSPLQYSAQEYGSLRSTIRTFLLNVH